MRGVFTPLPNDDPKDAAGFAQTKPGDQMKYDLQRLGPFGFQDLAAALAMKTLGAHVQRMGRGRDGGRDMLATGTILWGASDVTPAEHWDGTTVFQVKHKATLSKPREDAAWFWGQVRKELVAWASPSSDRGDVPHYLVFVTNVPLTPTPETGGFDTVNNKIQSFLDDLDDEHAEDHLEPSAQRHQRAERRARRDRMKRLRSWRLWDGYQIDGLVDANDGIRRAFDGFLTAGDVLKDLSVLSTSLSDEELGPALSAHARRALIQERNIYFDEAGGDTRGVPVEQVAIDLPVYTAGSKVPKRVIQHVLDRGDHILKPSLSMQAKPRHLVIAGAPGNGKTTVSKFLVHAYRCALVHENVSDLADQHRQTVTQTAEALQKMNRWMPSHRRWPFRVDLAEFAKRKATDADYTLLTWITDTLSAQASTKSVKRWVLTKWLRAWPAFLALDGLDEVTEPTVRKGLISDVDAFVAEAEAEDWDILVVVTTRPTGYADEMSTDVFERVDLADLSVQDALAYGRLVTRVRIPDDDSRRENIEKLLAEAASDEALTHLMRTPLQVLIMSIIAETSRQFSPSRYNLFWRYYQTVEAREQTKTLGFSSLLRDHSHQVLDLHRRVGLILQDRAELSSGATAVLSPKDLRDIAWQVLADAEYEPSTTHAGLLDQIVRAVTHRLVLLAPRGDDGYGFDVRSLQELMAALELTTGTIDQVMPRLRQIAPSPHWRNTLLFAAGRYFAEPQPAEHEAITNLILTIDDDASERLGALFPIGPELAWEVIDDGMSAGIPRWHNKFLKLGLTMLHKPEITALDAFARVVVRAASTSENARTMIREELRVALGGTATARGTAKELQQAIQVLADESDIPVPVQALTSVRRDVTRPLPPDPIADWESFEAAMTGLVSERSRGAAARIVDAVFKLRNGDFEGIATLTGGFDDLLEDAEFAEALQLALPYVIEGDSLLYRIILDGTLPQTWRRPVKLLSE